MKKIDLTGHKYGLLTVIGEHGSPAKRTMWDCSCECGGAATVQTSNLRHGNTSSCGCIRRKKSAEHARQLNRTHGMTNSTEYTSYHAMIGRCYRKSNARWHRYGGRGITVCDRWLESFDNFFTDMGSKPAGCLLDRIDNDGDYTPDNCRWADIQTSNINRDRSRCGAKGALHSFNGESMTIREWASRYGKTPSMVYKRLHRGWTLERALLT